LSFSFVVISSFVKESENIRMLLVMEEEEEEGGEE